MLLYDIMLFVFEKVAFLLKNILKCNNNHDDFFFRVADHLSVIS